MRKYCTFGEGSKYSGKFGYWSCLEGEKNCGRKEVVVLKYRGKLCVETERSFSKGGPNDE